MIGNQVGERDDCRGVDCDQIRLALSSALDGEEPELTPSVVDDHLARCEHCRGWREAAHVLTRRLRIQQDGVAPAPPEDLLVTVRPSRRSGSAWWKSAAAVRAGLVVVAAVQLAVTVPMLFLGRDRGASVHVAHEMGSLDVAVAVGLLVAARRPARALGMLALVATAALLLVTTAGVDLVSGHTTWTNEAPHLLILAGWMLLRRLAVLSPSGGERPTAAVAILGELRRALAGAAGRLSLPPGSTRLPAPAVVRPTADTPPGWSGHDRMAS